MGGKASKAVSSQRTVNASDLVSEAAQFSAGHFNDDELSSHIELLVRCKDIPRIADMYVIVFERDSTE